MWAVGGRKCAELACGALEGFGWEEGEGGLRHSTVRVVGVWYLTFSWSLYQSQSIASFGGLAAILSLSRISTQPEIDLSDHYRHSLHSLKTRSSCFQSLGMYATKLTVIFIGHS